MDVFRNPVPKTLDAGVTSGILPFAPGAFKIVPGNFAASTTDFIQAAVYLRKQWRSGGYIPLC